MLQKKLIIHERNDKKCDVRVKKEQNKRYMMYVFTFCQTLVFIRSATVNVSE